jgi:hypothetical protein
LWFGLAASSRTTLFGRESPNSTGGTFTRETPSFTGAHPKSEIKMAEMLQDVGAEMNRKNRSHTQRGLVRFFQFISAHQIAADRPF